MAGISDEDFGAALSAINRYRGEQERKRAFGGSTGERVIPGVNAAAVDRERDVGPNKGMDHADDIGAGGFGGAGGSSSSSAASGSKLKHTYTGLDYRTRVELGEVDEAKSDPTL